MAPLPPEGWATTLSYVLLLSILAEVGRRPYSAAVEETSVPRIPVQPVSYGDAIHFLEQLSELSPPEDWVGGLPIPYMILQSEDNTK